MNYLSRWFPSSSVLDPVRVSFNIYPLFRNKGHGRGRREKGNGKKQGGCGLSCVPASHFTAPAENNKEKQTIIDNLTFSTAAAPFEMKMSRFLCDTIRMRYHAAFFFFFIAKAYCTALVNYLLFNSLLIACLPIWTMVM